MKSRFLHFFRMVPVVLFCGLTARAQTISPRFRPPLPKSPVPSAESRVTALPVEKFKLLCAGTGWVSTGGRILMTTDNGGHWKDISPPNPDIDGMADVFFLDKNTGWVLLAHQVEEGENPTPDSPENQEVLYVRATTDGGSTWTKENLPVWRGQHGLNGAGIITFADGLHGWMSLDEARSTLFASSSILSTSDGGKSWRWANSGIDGVVGGVLAVTDRDIWMVGRSDEGGPQLSVSRDSGVSFQPVVLPAPKEIAPFDSPEYDLPVFSSSLNGYVVVDFSDDKSDRSDSAKVLFATHDSGRTWKLDNILSNAYKHEVLNYAIAGGTWIVSFAPRGSQPALIRLDAGSRASLSKHPIGGAASCRLSLLTQSDGWESCSDGLFSTNDGGASWATVAPRVRNGVFTTDPITPIKTRPVTMKVIRLVQSKATASMVEVASEASAAGSGPGTPADEHLGFDISAYMKPSEMQVWWNSSPYYDAIFYAPGAPSHPGTKQFNAAWVSAIIAQGWGLIPTWVGYQSYSACKNQVPYPACLRYRNQISPFPGAVGTQSECEEIAQIKGQYDPQKDTAWNQGICQADAAIAKFGDLGFTGSIAYLDVEGFVPSASQAVNGQNYTCLASVRAYVGGWVQEMHAKGSLAGVYGSASNVRDAFGPENPDDIYIAGGKAGVTVWNQGYRINDSLWPNRQRIHQYQETTTQVWGGLSESIDLDIVDAPIVPSSGSKQYVSPDPVPYNFSAVGEANGYNDGQSLHLPPGVNTYSVYTDYPG